MPLAAIILLIVAAILIVLASMDRRKGENGNPIARKTWLRIAAIFVVVALFVILVPTIFASES